MISDYFPPSSRATALAVYCLGISFGVLIGFMLGGWIGEFFGWRWAFVIAGAPGIVLSIFVWFALREPPRGHADRVTVTAGPSHSIFKSLGYLARRPSFRHLALAAALTNIAYIGSWQWIPSFFVRTHGLSTGEIGTWLAFAIGVVGGVGTYVGGVVNDRWGAKDARWYFWLPGIAILVVTPLLFLVLLYLPPRPALALFSVPTFAVAFGVSAIYAMAQGLAPLHMRAVASAAMLFMINLIGQGVGPLAIGGLSDLTQGALGSDSLRYSLLIVMVIGSLWSGLHFILGARTVREDLALALRS